VPQGVTYYVTSRSRDDKKPPPSPPRLNDSEKTALEVAKQHVEGKQE